MSKRSLFTMVTPVPAGISRECIMSFLYSHVEMVDLNPLVIERHPIRASPHASAEEAHCEWYEITDKVQYIPGGVYSGKVTYTGCFHNLPNGLQTHCFAPMGLNIRSRWQLGGSLPGEPKQVNELGLGIPKEGLWLREDVDMKCNIFMINFVKKTFRKAHLTLVDRLVEKAHILEAQAHNEALERASEVASVYSRSSTSPGYQAPLTFQDTASSGRPGDSRHASYQRQDPQQPLYPPPGYNQAPLPLLPYTGTERSASPYLGGSPNLVSRTSFQPTYDPRRSVQAPPPPDKTFRDPHRASYELKPRTYSFDHKANPYGLDSNLYALPGNPYSQKHIHPAYKTVELPGAHPEMVPKPLSFGAARQASQEPTELE
ncbi:hypothetical protein MMC13_003758 [Lambiella insularis]|nr:hypothetical protein [Lambiella insularis]